ncbi:Z1 domain-containing protein [Streptomyces sp. WAC01280]|uniref:Z1 domain-containing protein n=1 Tax=Streptomyces sp. WAC01280 TaxID=2487424 RepID=UPI000F775E55|nr:Z1 domain-containing protein [Streptomyces sp. WAC01280]RSS55317.1 endonuclease [Streptomyces sp. WAC01280]
MDLAVDKDLARALKAAIQLLPEDRQASPEDVSQAVTGAVMIAKLQSGAEIDAEELRKLVEARTNVFQEISAALSDDSGHIAWLPDAKNDRRWAFWERYERYLSWVRDMAPQAVRSIDRTTDEVLGELEDPNRPGQWRRRGLVIGQVQSGKTGQFIGLAAKAADAGYKLIVVFAGIHNDLRSQTQLRIDEGLLGFDTQFQLRSDQEGANYYIGVGNMAGESRLAIASLTNSAEDGDFNGKTASKANLPIGHFPIILVVKKHPKMINHLRSWVTDKHGVEDSKTGRKIVRDVPLFVIDDEADNASINTADIDADPTKINSCIRELLASFERSAYVGYTATPYANIYIDPDASHDTLGNDLFPDSFIRTLRAPSNYLGPERLFGLTAYSEEEADIEPLPLVRYAEDTGDWVPEKHKSGYVPTADLPESLVVAIRSFVLACAARRVRGQVNVHNSMLVHVTRFTSVQGHVREQIEDYVRMLQHSLRDRYGTASRDLIEELRELWEKDFIDATRFFTAEDAPRLSWDAVASEILPSLLKIQVKAINGVAKDALDYYTNSKKGLYVIAVGGQKLSRGLTLEGLSVSYYLRFAKTYDTLLQMGRWFGYRQGYEDLCRLFTTPQLEAAYREITVATDELRRDIEEMSVLGYTPRQFGLKVRTSSLGMSITAANKMRRGTRVRLSYSGELAETTIFPLTGGIPEKNFKNLRTFSETLLAQSAPSVDDTTGSLVWSDVHPEMVAAGFFDAYKSAPEANRIRPELIAEYIRHCARQGELNRWTVRIVSRRDGSDSTELVGHTLGQIVRAASNTARTVPGRHTIKRVLSPKDEALDLDKKQCEAALAKTKQLALGEIKRNGEPRNPALPSSFQIRMQRRPDQPLLLLYLIEAPEGSGVKDPLIGFAASFPNSLVDNAKEYVVNVPWWNQDDEVEADEANEDAK